MIKSNIMQKSTILVHEDDIRIGFSFTKVDKEKRTVTGIATADNVDKEGDLIDSRGSKEAFAKWMGNIREMHGPKAVGKAVDYKEVRVQDREGNIFDGFEVTSYISKGAQDTWEKVLDGTLAGYSIGGRVLEKSKEMHKGGKIVSRILKYALTELSVVDNPCNPLAEFTMIKSVGGGELEGTSIITEINDKTVWYCDKHEIATVDTSSCPVDGTDMFEIGFIESIEGFVPETINKMISDFDLKKSPEGGAITSQFFSETGGGKDLQNNENNVTVNAVDDLTAEQKETVLGKFAKFLFGGDKIDKVTGVPLMTEGMVIDSGEKVDDATEDSMDIGCDPNCEDCASGNCETCANCQENMNTAKATASAEKKETSMEKETVEKVDAATEEVIEKAEATEEVAETTEVEEVTKAEGFDPVSLLEDIKKAVADTVGDAAYGWKADFSVFGSRLDDITGNVERISKRVDALEEAGAIKKSVDSEKEDEVVIEKSTTSDSVWGNVFLPKNVITALGYES